jgi:hypothetical protein
MKKKLYFCGSRLHSTIGPYPAEALSPVLSVSVIIAMAPTFGGSLPKNRL